MKRILIIAVVGAVSFIAGYHIAKRRTNAGWVKMGDEIVGFLDEMTKRIGEDSESQDEVPEKIVDDDDKEDFCYDE